MMHVPPNPAQPVGLGERDPGHASAENHAAHQEGLLSDRYCPAPGSLMAGQTKRPLASET